MLDRPAPVGAAAASDAARVRRARAISAPHLAAQPAASGLPADRARPRRAAPRRPARRRRGLGRLAPRRSPSARDSVITCLPSPAAVAAVVAGRGRRSWTGLRAGRRLDRHEHQRPRTRSSASPRWRRRAASRLLEAPVTGGVHKAATGEITVLVGGDAAVFEAHRPAFEAMGGKVFHMGPLGSASVIKVITNMLAFIHLVGGRRGADAGQARRARPRHRRSRRSGRARATASCTRPRAR